MTQPNQTTPTALSTGPWTSLETPRARIAGLLGADAPQLPTAVVNELRAVQRELDQEADRKFVVDEIEAPCRACSGSGMRGPEGGTCSACNGNGVEWVKVKLTCEVIPLSTLSRLVEELEARADDAHANGDAHKDETTRVADYATEDALRDAASLISQSLPTTQEDE